MRDDEPASNEFKAKWLAATQKELEIEELEDVFVYLDDLRESGLTNMFGASPYVQEEFGYNRTEAQLMVSKWMKTFKEDVAPEDRARATFGDDK